MANALTITTLSVDHCITTVRRNEDRGINMHIVTEVQRAMLDVEAGELDCASYRARIEALPQDAPKVNERVRPSVPRLREYLLEITV